MRRPNPLMLPQCEVHLAVCGCQITGACRRRKTRGTKVIGNRKIEKRQWSYISPDATTPASRTSPKSTGDKKKETKQKEAKQDLEGFSATEARLGRNVETIYGSTLRLQRLHFENHSFIRWFCMST